MFHARPETRFGATAKAGTDDRFVRGCSDAAFGYANAATAAYAEMARQAFGMWTAALGAMMPAEKPEPRSWYRHPDERTPSLPSFMPGFPPAAFVAPGAAVSPAGFGPQAFAVWGLPSAPMPSFDAMMAPWTTWIAMWSGPRVATAWPMAFVMVANGVPRAVAVPAAEAHAAVLDAAQVAVDQLSQAYSSYRSDGGHAQAQVVYERRKPSASTPPRERTPGPAARATTPMWPWLLH